VQRHAPPVRHRSSLAEPGYRDGLDRDGDGVAFERSSKSTFWRARVDNARTSISA